MLASNRDLPNAETPNHGAGWRRIALGLILLFTVTILCCWPIVVYGLADRTNDCIFHTPWQKIFSTQLSHGEMYPRWLADENLGLGSPTFFFYPPVPAYASSVFAIFLAQRDPEGLLQAGYGCALAIFLSGIVAYFWLRSHVSAGAALFGAVIYLIAPYKITICLYNRGAVNEVWAFVWLPLIMHFAEGLARRAKWSFLGLAATYSALVMTHLPTIVCLSPVLLLSGTFLAERGKKFRAVLATLGAMALGSGLAGIFLAPALMNQGNVHIEYVLNGFGQRHDYRSWWYFHKLTWPPDTSTVLFFQNGSILFLIALLFMLLLSHRVAGGRKRAAFFYLFVTLFAFFFTTQLSYPFWRLLPSLRIIQYPWRFSILLALAVSAFSAFSFPHLGERRARWVAACLGIIVAGWIAVNGLSAKEEFSMFRKFRSPAGVAKLDPFKNPTDACEYWPITAAQGQPCGLWTERVQILNKLLDGQSPKSASLTDATSGQPAGSAIIEDWQPRTAILDVNAPAQSRLIVRHFYYPGWQARVEDPMTSVARQVPVIASIPEGFLQMDLPEGDYKLVLTLTKQPAERLGIALSAVSLLFTLVLFVLVSRRRNV